MKLAKLHGLRILPGSVAAVAMLAAAGVSCAATPAWTGASGVNNKWTTAGNWNPSGQPGASGTAIFNINANTAVSMSGVVAAGFISFDTGAGSFSFNTAGTSFTLTAGYNTTIQTGVGIQNGVGASRTESFNIPVILAGGYTLTNQSPDAGTSLAYTAGITTTATSATTLALSGAGTGTNLISGVVSDNANNSSGKVGITSTATAGAWNLSNANTYTGATKVQSGTLILTGGSIATPVKVLAGTDVTIGNSAAAGSLAKLKIAGNVSIGNGAAGTLTLVGGNGTDSTAGTLDMADGTLNTLTLANTSTTSTVMSIGGNAKAAALNFDVGATDVDHLNLTTGLLNIGGTGGIISLNALSAPTITTTYTLISGGLAAGSLDYSHLTFADGGYTKTIGGNLYTLSSTATTELLTVAVPEPVTAGMAVMMTMAGFLRRRRRGARVN